MPSQSEVSAITRALEVLETLTEAQEELTVTSLASILKLNKGVTSRILATLRSRGYVSQDPRTRVYRPTFKVVSLGNRYVERLGFPDVCMPILNELADQTEELVQMAVVEGDDMWFVAKAEGKHRLRLLSALGKKVVLHATASGKAWLASLPEDRALALISRQGGLLALTPRTIVSMEEFLKQLKETRVRGFAIAQDENIEGGSAVGAAIRSERHGSLVVGAVGVAGPSTRMTRDRLFSLGEGVIEAARRLGEIWTLDPRAARYSTDG